MDKGGNFFVGDVLKDLGVVYYQILNI